MSQGLNTETGYIETFVEYCERDQTKDNIVMTKFSASDKDSNNNKNKKCSNKFKEREDNGKKRRKNSSLCCSLHGENNSHTSRDWKLIRKRASYKDKSKYGNKYYKNNFKEINLLQAEAAHQTVKYDNLNKSFTKRNTSKEDTFNIADSSDINSSSSSDSNSSSPETGKLSITYDSYSSGYEKISSSSISSEDNNWLNCCRYVLIINKSKTNSKSNLRRKKIGSNNLDKSLYDAYLLNTLQKPTNKGDKQTKSHN